MHDTYLGALGQQGTTKVIRSQRGERPNCPAGWQVMGRHGSGIRESVECYMPQQFAPPPVTTTTITVPTSVSVPTSLQTQISPMISPTLAQQQASPGAAVQSAPSQVAPAPMTRQTGISASELREILEAQAAARAAEDAARERQRAAEISELNRQMSERARATDAITAAQRADEARRIEQERFAREQSELEARESAAAMPPPMSFAPPSPLQPPIQAAAPITQPMLTEAEQRSDIDVTAPPTEAGVPPWLLIALAAAGVGVVMLTGKKRNRGRKR